MKQYDVVAIGSSPKVFIKLLEYAKKGAKTLLVNNHSNWSIIDFSSIKNVEDGCFFIDYSQSDYKMLNKELSINLEKLKFEPSFIYKNNLYPISSDFLDGKYEPTVIYKYPKNGLIDIIQAIEKNLKLYSIDTKNQNISSIFIDFDRKDVTLNSNIKTKKVLAGYNLNISKIQSSKSDLILNRKITNYFTYLIVKVKFDIPINFSLIDFTHCKNNNFKTNLNDKIVCFRDFKKKFLWRVKDLTPFSSLKSSRNQKIICIDTDNWLPKKEFEYLATMEIFNFLKEKNLISNFTIEEFIYKSRLAYSIEEYIDNIENLFSPYLEIINPLFYKEDEK